MNTLFFDPYYSGPDAVHLGVAYNRIFYAGLSQGALFGAILMAAEPDIQTAVLTSGAGSLADTFRWVKEGPSRAGAVAAMTPRNPPLFNAGPQDYDYDWPLRYQPVRVISVPGSPPTLVACDGS